MVAARILVVEDEGIVAMGIKDSIQSMGYDVCSVEVTGEDAVERAGRERPDLVLMDIVLAGEMDGIEAAELIRSRYNTPIVYLTAHTDEKTLRRAKGTVPHGYIVKPFQERELQATIETVLYRHNLERELEQYREHLEEMVEERTAELRKSKDKYRSLVNEINDGFYILDSKGVFTFANPALATIFGCDGPEEMIGKNFQDFMPPQELDGTKGRFMEMMRTGKFPELIESPIVKKDGIISFIQLKPVPLIEDGMVVGGRGVVRDITKRKEAEDGLRESEERLRLLIESAEDIIVMQDRDGRYTYYNGPPAYGLEYKDILGKTPHEFHEKPVADIIMARVKKVFETGKALNDESSIPWKGQTIYFSDSLNPVFDVEGNVLGVVTISRNITDRKKAEWSLRIKNNAIESATEAIAIVDMKGKVTYVNPSFTLMWGYEKDDILGKPIFEISPIKERIAELIEMVHKEGSWSGEIEATRKDGSKFFIHASGTLVRDDGGEPIRMMTSMIDITARKEAKMKLEDTYTELEEAYDGLKTLDETKDNIIMNVSHELRTPITIISGALGLAETEEDKEGRNKLLKMAKDALMRQDRIVGNMVAIAKREMRRAELNIEDINLTQVSTIAVGDIKAQAEAKGIKIEDNMPNIMVKADFDGIRNAFINILDNAVKFTVGEGKITISAEEGNDMVEVCIKDTGVGIPKDALDKVFDRLYQVDATATRRYGGTGMGLAVAKDIVEVHSGKMWVESEEGKGSKFFFSLPLAKEG